MNTLGLIDSLPSEDVLDMFCDILHSNFAVGRELYFARIFHSMAREVAIDIFKSYFNLMRDSLRNNLPVLSDLATVFAAEPGSAQEYRDVCKLIEEYLQKHPPTG